MKHNYFLSAVAAAAMVLSANAHAVTDLGPVDISNPASVTIDVAANTSFSDQYTFSIASKGSNVISTSLVVLGSAGSKILSFAGVLAGPGGISSPYAYQEVPFDVLSGFGLQILSVAVNQAPTGNYSITISGKGGTEANSYSLDVSAGPIPEPETLALMLAGLGVVGLVGVRRKVI